MMWVSGDMRPTAKGCCGVLRNVASRERWESEVASRAKRQEERKALRCPLGELLFASSARYSTNFSHGAFI